MIRRCCCCFAALWLLGPLFAAEEITFQKFKLADGQNVIGTYDEVTGILTVVDGRTGGEIGALRLAKEAISSSQKVKIKLTAAPAKLPVGADGEWTTSYEEALKLAKLSGRPMAIWFTGSDWCGWCVKLDKEVFKTDKFRAWSGKNLILLCCDFPRRTTLAPDLQKQNDALKTKYPIDGYPTIVVIDVKGRELWRGGYLEGGPDAWIAKCKEGLSGKVR